MVENDESERDLSHLLTEKQHKILKALLEQLRGHEVARAYGFTFELVNSRVWIKLREDLIGNWRVGGDYLVLERSDGLLRVVRGLKAAIAVTEEKISDYIE